MRDLRDADELRAFDERMPGAWGARLIARRLTRHMPCAQPLPEAAGITRFSWRQP